MCARNTHTRTQVQTVAYANVLLSPECPGCLAVAAPVHKENSNPEAPGGSEWS